MRENPCETTVMLTWPSRDSQENGTGQAQSSLVLDERAVEKFLRSRPQQYGGLGMPLKMSGGEKTKIKLAITVLDNH